MKPFLLDTNVIIDALRKRNNRHLLVEQFLNQGQPLASCPITITEIYAGIAHREGCHRDLSNLAAGASLFRSVRKSCKVLVT